MYQLFRNIYQVRVLPKEINFFQKKMLILIQCDIQEIVMHLSCLKFVPNIIMLLVLKETIELWMRNSGGRTHRAQCRIFREINFTKFFS